MDNGNGNGRGVKIPTEAILQLVRGLIVDPDGVVAELNEILRSQGKELILRKTVSMTPVTFERVPRVPSAEWHEPAEMAGA